MMERETEAHSEAAQEPASPDCRFLKELQNAAHIFLTARFWPALGSALAACRPPRFTAGYFPANNLFFEPDFLLGRIN